MADKDGVNGAVQRFVALLFGIDPAVNVTRGSAGENAHLGGQAFEEFKRQSVAKVDKAGAGLGDFEAAKK